MFDFLKRWRKPPATRRPARVILYTRQGCHLCEDAWETLRQQQAYFDFSLEVIDIDSDPALARSYGECVPVVSVNGKERFRGSVNRVLLKRLLQAEAERDAGEQD
jgi:glutaredoxin